MVGGRGASLISSTDVTQALHIDEQPKTPQAPATRLTRRQLAKLEEEEALSKPQHVPSEAETDGVEDVAEQTVKQTEAVVEERTNAAPVQNETTPAQAQHTQVKPESTPRPARRTRRQQGKLEEEHTPTDAGEPTVIESSVEATGNVVTEHDRTIAAIDDPTEVGSQPAPKPNRLTRHQQEKLEAEQRTSSIEQQTSQSELLEREELDAISSAAPTRLQVEYVKEGTDKATDVQTNDVEETVAPASVEDMYPGDTEKFAVGSPVTAENAKSSIFAESQNGDSQIAIEARPTTPTDAEFDAEFDAQIDSPVADDVTPLVDVTSGTEPKMLCDEKPFGTSVSVPNTNQDATRRLSRSLSKSPMRIEESISAIDRLEEDLESIGEAIPDFDHSDDEKYPQKSTAMCGKTPTKTPMKSSAHLPAQGAAKLANKTLRKTPAQVPVTKKAPLHTRISRVPDAAPKSVKPTTASLTRASSVRTAPKKDAGKTPGEPADYLASKRRPISLSFPTPPPPPKGRASTKPTFQLSSDNVAAKLKAQKEERLKREAGRTTAPLQRPVSMPPLPKSTKPPTVPTFQLSSEATAARLKAQKEARMKRMEEAGGVDKPAVRPISMSAAPKSAKPITKPNFQLPGEATAARLKAQKEERLKRMEEAEAAKKNALAAPVRKPIVHRPRESLLVKDAPGVSIPPAPQTNPSQRSTSLASKRKSVVEPSTSRSISTSSSNCRSVLLAEGAKSTVTPMDAAALKMKGKQVFNRDKMEKEDMERERKEKEEAAKRARAEAAERGRIASREWAERQQKKKMMMRQ